MRCRKCHCVCTPAYHIKRFLPYSHNRYIRYWNTGSLHRYRSFLYGKSPVHFHPPDWGNDHLFSCSASLEALCFGGFPSALSDMACSLLTQPASSVIQQSSMHSFFIISSPCCYFSIRLYHSCIICEYLLFTVNKMQRWQKTIEKNADIQRSQGCI